jgi:hypothetical protein
VQRRRGTKRCANDTDFLSAESNMFDKVTEVVVKQTAVPVVVRGGSLRTAIAALIVNQTCEVMTHPRDLLPPRKVRAARAVNEDNRRPFTVHLVVQLNAISV